MESRSYNLEERLIKFAVMILRIAEEFPSTYAGKHLSGQITRSGTSPALNYGEAQGGESHNDFLHKIKICLKELRETQVALKIAADVPMLSPEKIAPVLKECSELVAIFTASVKTGEARKRQNVK
ncbi:MAG: four helix bundle protein [Saprospiraceae bacterium]|nr:four helix bundle protein [Saprospiraceae bacterium]